MFGLAASGRSFEEVKDRFDPSGLFNPGKIVRAPKFDDRTNFRYAPGYHAQAMTTQLGLGRPIRGRAAVSRAPVEMCSNNVAPAVPRPAA